MKLPVKIARVIDMIDDITGPIGALLAYVVGHGIAIYAHANVWVCFGAGTLTFLGYCSLVAIANRFP